MTIKFQSNDFIDRVKQNSIDVFITSASFEERCLVIPKIFASHKVKSSIVFFSVNEDMEIYNNAQLIRNELNNECNIVSLNTDSPIKNYFSIDQELQKIIQSFGKSNLLIDSTTFTHESLLVLLKLLSIKREFFGTINFAYVAADEYSIKSNSDEDKWLSKGVQKIRTVLGYPGFTDPTQKNHLLILFGFESERTKRLIEEYEFENISLGFGDIKNSIQSNHQKINFDRHQKLLNEYPNANKFIFSLTNPIETKNQILDYLDDVRFKNLNTVIAPLNNKLSTLGAGLAAISNENLQLAYAKPNLYNINGYSKPSNSIYLSEEIL